MVAAQENSSAPSTDPMIWTAIKTPLMPKAVMVLVPGRFSLREAAKHLVSMQTDDPAVRRMALQVQRETKARHTFLVPRGARGLEAVNPDETSISQVAVPREIRTLSGNVEIIPTAAFEVQAYAPVGRK